LEFFAGRGDHRFEVPEVGGLGSDLGSDHDLVLVDHGLRVVALHEPATRFQQPAVRVGRVDLALRQLGWRERLDGPGRHPAMAVGADPGRPPRLILSVRLALDLELLLKAPLGLPQPLRPRAGHRLGVRGTLVLKPLARLTQPWRDPLSSVRCV
jgi:hypothetical protein